MKAISLWQPWAQLIADDRKKIETRSWGTSYRGPLAIHATVGHMDVALAWRVGYYEPRRLLRRGAVVCVVQLLDCLMMTPKWIESVSRDERLLGNYAPWRHAWLMRLLRVFSQPIPARGAGYLWEWNEPAAPELDLAREASAGPEAARAEELSRGFGRRPIPRQMAGKL